VETDESSKLMSHNFLLFFSSPSLLSNEIILQLIYLCNFIIISWQINLLFVPSFLLLIISIFFLRKNLLIIFYMFMQFFLIINCKYYFKRDPSHH
jgi:hypothetical protein